MADIKHQDLAVRVPRDVRARASKAGAEDFDWYAGRLDESPACVRGSSPSSHKSGHLLAVQSHRKARSAPRRSVATLLVALRRHAASLTRNVRASRRLPH
jgi:hypothetical protein